jgi:putative intracellular protease/amidase
MTPRRIGFLGFDGVQSLDFVGPADAFTSDAFDAVAPGGDQDRRPYDVVIIGVHGRRFTTSAGMVLQADTTLSTSIALDTLIVPGGKGLRKPGVADAAAKWIVGRAPRIRRIASVCTGIYGLAPTGLLDGRRVATHWSAVRDVAQRFPRLQVDPDAIFVKDGPFYTSAGITAGIDLAMAMIEEDCGADAALAVAREMVVYLKRPGDSSSSPSHCASKSSRPTDSWKSSRGSSPTFAPTCPWASSPGERSSAPASLPVRSRTGSDLRPARSSKMHVWLRPPDGFLCATCVSTLSRSLSDTQARTSFDVPSNADSACRRAAIGPDFDTTRTLFP